MPSLTRSLAYAALGLMPLAVASEQAAHADEWPEKPITLIVPWGAGGGTDATARMIGTLLEERLEVPVPIVNRTGGSGVVGHSAIANAEPDGYTIGVATLEIGGMHHQGLTDLTYEAYDPIGLYNSDPAALFVSNNSEYQSPEELLDKIRGSAHREMKASGSAQGGVNHIAMAGMLLSAGIEPGKVAWVPSEGAAPGLQDLAAGGVDFATASLPEGRALMDAGLIRPLAIYSSQRSSSSPDIPTFEESTGLDWSFGSWRGLVAPAGVDGTILAILREAVGELTTDEDYLEFMESRGYATEWVPGEEFMEFMATSDRRLGETMKALGIAK